MSTHVTESSQQDHQTIEATPTAASDDAQLESRVSGMNYEQGSESLRPTAAGGGGDGESAPASANVEGERINWSQAEASLDRLGQMDHIETTVNDAARCGAASLVAGLILMGPAGVTQGISSAREAIGLIGDTTNDNPNGQRADGFLSQASEHLENATRHNVRQWRYREAHEFIDAVFFIGAAYEFMDTASINLDAGLVPETVHYLRGVLWGSGAQPRYRVDGEGEGQAVDIFQEQMEGSRALHFVLGTGRRGQESSETDVVYNPWAGREQGTAYSQAVDGDRGAQHLTASQRSLPGQGEMYDIDRGGDTHRTGLPQDVSEQTLPELVQTLRMGRAHEISRVNAASRLRALLGDLASVPVPDLIELLRDPSNSEALDSIEEGASGQVRQHLGSRTLDITIEATDGRDMFGTMEVFLTYGGGQQTAPRSLSDGGHMSVSLRVNQLVGDLSRIPNSFIIAIKDDDVIGDELLGTVMMSNADHFSASEAQSRFTSQYINVTLSWS